MQIDELSSTSKSIPNNEERVYLYSRLGVEPEEFIIQGSIGDPREGKKSSTFSRII